MALNSATFGGFVGHRPANGCKYMPLALPLQAGVEFNTDIIIEQGSQLEFVQSIFIDNSANAQPVKLTFGGSGQVIQIAANSQGWFTVLTIDQVSFRALCSASFNLNIWLCNEFVPACVWKSI